MNPPKNLRELKAAVADLRKQMPKKVEATMAEKEKWLTPTRLEKWNLLRKQDMFLGNQTPLERDEAVMLLTYMTLSGFELAEDVLCSMVDEVRLLVPVDLAKRKRAMRAAVKPKAR